MLHITVDKSFEKVLVTDNIEKIISFFIKEGYTTEDGITYKSDTIIAGYRTVIIFNSRSTEILVATAWDNLKEVDIENIYGNLEDIIDNNVCQYRDKFKLTEESVLNYMMKTDHKKFGIKGIIIRIVGSTLYSTAISKTWHKNGRERHESFLKNLKNMGDEKYADELRKKSAENIKIAKSEFQENFSEYISLKK